MENKIITDLNKNLDSKYHPNIKGVQIIEGKNNFPISWLNQQGYCEYQLYLQYFQGVKVGETQAMTTGFSKTEKTVTREMFVISPEYGIRGFIDEIWMTPDEFVIIDDKPGNQAYGSTINQVRAYCLAFKNMINDKRKIVGALRQRGTDNIFWSEEFDEDAQKSIKFLIDRMDGLFKGEKPFIKTKNPNKCKSCRFQSYCIHD